jgi:hypothetical protein
MLRRRGVPHDLDPVTAHQIERTFLAVRIVRGSLMLTFLMISFGAVVAKHWPAGVAVAVGLTVALQTARLSASVRRYLRTRHRSLRGT